MKFYKCNNDIVCLELINGIWYSSYVVVNGALFQDNHPVAETTNWYKDCVIYKSLSKSETDKLKLRLL